MRMTSLLLTLGAVAGAPPAAAADENTPCPASRPTPQLSLVDKGAGTTLYATQELRLTVSQPGEEFAPARSVVAPGARAVLCARGPNKSLCPCRSVQHA